MTQPVQEPTQGRSIAGLEFRSRQLFRRPASPPGTFVERTVGEFGNGSGSSTASTVTMTVDHFDLPAGDGILVLAQAPTIRAGPVGPFYPTSCADTQGNSYTLIHTSLFEPAVQAPATGLCVALFWCAASVATMVDGVDTITATWGGSVSERMIQAWQVRHAGGANTPNVLGFIADNNAAVYASTQQTLSVPAWTPARNVALDFAILVTMQGATGSWGGVVGYNGFYEASQKGWYLNGRDYRNHWQTSGADVSIVARSGITSYELDFGTLTATLQAGFNGVGQNYSGGANTWKGIILLGID